MLSPVNDGNTVPASDMSNPQMHHGVRPAPFPVEARNRAQRQPIINGEMTPSQTATQASSVRLASLSPPPPSEIDRMLSPSPSPEPESLPHSTDLTGPSSPQPGQLSQRQLKHAAYRASDRGREAKAREKIGRAARKAVKDAEQKLSAALKVRSTRSRPNHKAIAEAQAEYEAATARLADFERGKQGRRSLGQGESAAARKREAEGLSGRVGEGK